MEQMKQLFWFTVYIVACAAVLLGLVALYVNFGVLLMAIAVGIICVLAILNERKKRPIYIMEPPRPRGGHQSSDTFRDELDLERSDYHRLPGDRG